jgi:hypothetical protein
MATEKQNERTGHIIRGTLIILILLVWMIFCISYAIPRTGVFGYVAMIIIGTFIGYMGITVFERAGLNIFKDW